MPRAIPEQPELAFDAQPGTGPSPFSVRLLFVRNARARRYILRLGRDRVARVTIPRGGTETYARQFAAKNEAWILRQLERLSATPPLAKAVPWTVGTPVWFRGTLQPLRMQDGALFLGDAPLYLNAEVLDHPIEGRRSVEYALRAQALLELPPLVLSFAARHGLKVNRVQVRDQRSRWGSCSRRRTISLNWRLIQIPEFVRDYLIAHELAHLREMNHSDRFWEVVAGFFPGWKEAESWLRRHGRAVIAGAPGIGASHPH